MNLKIYASKDWVEERISEIDMPENVIQYTEQELTDEQKSQAQNNIGIQTTTDEEIIELLIQEDMLPTVIDSDGSFLTDENENILLW